ncbi:hypothetical protein RND71_018236 [Anisodus tanguticus]|uniref:F-box associated beta-propeller type 1 domain-containing protein n=1 Tax=Anisodus tanguticus TaxID=243964 RepID=A0AAE1VJZ7_9SOLA|nr:hypothetical protein RND71_018236 [Anisodus tanguticus]
MALKQLMVIESQKQKNGRNIPPEVEVFSLNTGAWRRVIGVEVKHCLVEFMWSQAFVNGSVHCIAYDVDPVNGGVRSLAMAFSVADEVFKEIMLPDDLVGEITMNLSVMVFEGSFVVVKYEAEIDGGSGEVWVMKSYGKVVGFRCNGEVLFSSRVNELVSYYPNSGDKKDLDDFRGSSRSFYVQNYVESLVLVQANSVKTDEFLDGIASLGI